LLLGAGCGAAEPEPGSDPDHVLVDDVSFYSAVAREFTVTASRASRRGVVRRADGRRAAGASASEASKRFRLAMGRREPRVSAVGTCLHTGARPVRDLVDRDATYR